jgi:hypothetical protein
MRPWWNSPNRVIEAGRMLAEEELHMNTGVLGTAIHSPHEQLLALTGFIAAQLPLWRDHTDRPERTGEDVLTYNLCIALNNAARSSTTWNHLQFLTQGPTEVDARRKIDINVHPAKDDLIFAGTRFTPFQPILPIECKRLPTPGGADRDGREYVYSAHNTSGGIHRFKIGAHGATYSFAAMIAYVQRNTCSHWLQAVNGWISDLSASDGQLWSLSDLLRDPCDLEAGSVTRMYSQHTRSKLDDILLEHLWIQM